MAALIVQRPSPESETRPSNFARAGSSIEGRGRQVEEPRRDDAPAPPDLGDVGKVQVVLVVLGVAERRRLGVDRVISLSDVRGAEDAEPFGVGSHEPVFDSVVDHLDEVARPVRPAVEVAVLRGPFHLVASRRQRDVPPARGEPLEDRVEMLHDVRLAADHHAVAPLEAPDAAARPDVHVVNALCREFLRAADVVDVVGVAAVDDDVPLFEQGKKVGDRLVDDGRWDHQPDRTGFSELLHESRRERRRRLPSP